MIQFNLLPDVKLEFVRAQRIKQTVITGSLIAAGTAFLIFLLLFITVNLVQKKSIGDLNDDIAQFSKELKDTPDLDKILTIQSQLSALPTLHRDKVAAGRIFTFIQQLTPANVSLSDFTTDFTANTLTITGQSASLDQVNTLVDTLKFTKYTTTEDTSKQAAFEDVVLSQFSRTSVKSGGVAASGTTFTITLNYKPEIFDNAVTVNLSVPTTVSTRSVVEQPTDIFKKPTTNTNGNAQ